MRVSEYFNLGKKQPSLDFIDVDTESDVAIFLDPRSMRLLPSDWGQECVALIQNFFSEILKLIADGNHQRAQDLLSSLREPNETHLGLSSERSRGRGMGSQSAANVWDALRNSDAVKSGILEELEDTVLMVEGIGPDIISDITTNLIREPLIRYTREACLFYGIPTGEVDSGPMWDPSQKRWYNELVQLPIADDRKLLLIPKICVRRRLDYDQDEYYRDYILEALRQEEFAANSGLIELLKNGRSRITNKALMEKYGTGKRVIVEHTLRLPSLLEKYRKDKKDEVQPPLDHVQVSAETNTKPPDWDALLNAVLSVEPGKEGATEYQNAVMDLLAALFYPSLTTPTKEVKTNEGRKRIDITFVNVAVHGFFFWVNDNYGAPYVLVECKNYKGDLANPELDQMAGRFAPNRGDVGLILCRGFDDKAKFIKRCRDSAVEDRGFIIVLDDADLAQLVAEARATVGSPSYQLLMDRFSQLVM